MRSKVIEIDVNDPKPIEMPSGYESMRIILKSGRYPIGQLKLPCEPENLDTTALKTLLANYRVPAPVEAPVVGLPHISVAVCTCNRHEDLKNALISISRQVYLPNEIIVVDNVGQPEVQKLVDEILPAARYMVERRPGLNFARNVASAAANSEIIAFLDDDAQADPYWLLAVAQAFCLHPHAAGVTGLVLPRELETPSQQIFEAHGVFNRGFERRVIPNDNHHRLGVKIPLAIQAVKAGSGCNMAFKTSALREIGCFDEALDTGPPLPGGGDLDIIYRLLKRRHNVVYEPGAYVYHSHRRDASQLNKQMSGHQRGFLAYLVKAFCEETGWQKLAVASYIAWRIVKTAFRPIRRLLGRDPLPFFLLVRMFLATIVGLGSYPASKVRNYKYTRVLSNENKGTMLQLLELWNYRELVWNLTMRNLKVKYKQSWLGFIWTLLNPILVASVLISIFSYIVRLPITHYWAFLISGYFVFNFFSMSLNGGIQSTIGNAYLSKCAPFPQEALILSSVFARFLEFLMELAIVLSILIVFHHKAFPVSLLMVFPLLIILLLLTIGIVFPLAAFSIFFNDAFQVIPILTMVLFYVSPVFYNVDLVPEGVRKIYLLNPLALLLKQFHTTLYSGKMPDITVTLLLLSAALGLCLIGYVLFNWKKSEFAEIV